MPTFEDLIIIGESIEFDFEDFIVSDLGIVLQKQSSDKNRSEGICKFYLKGFCAKGNNCQFQHTMTASGKSEKTVVCKHWLRGLCKKGDICEFLHEYNMKKMPECWFFAKYGECSNPECLYLHIDPNTKGRDCVWYMRGFCRHGPECKHKHTRKAVCQLYLTGFCPLGPECTFGHPKFELPNMDQQQNQAPAQPQSHFQQQQHHTQHSDSQAAQTGFKQGFRAMEDVTCFKCGETGHFANHCPTRRVFGNVQ